MDVVKETGTYIHLFVMTSEKNNDATVSFFEEKDFFGYKSEYVHFFKQEMAEPLIMMVRYILKIREEWLHHLMVMVAGISL